MSETIFEFIKTELLITKNSLELLNIEGERNKRYLGRRIKKLDVAIKILDNLNLANDVYFQGEKDED